MSVVARLLRDESGDKMRFPGFREDCRILQERLMPIVIGGVEINDDILRCLHMALEHAGISARLLEDCTRCS